MNFPAAASRQATIATFLGAALAAESVVAAGAYETEDFADVVTTVEALADEHGGENVLLVCDVDNTLLAMDNELGSDQWFEWQEYLLEHEPDSHYLVAENFDQLLVAQGLLFALGKMHPPQPDLPDHIKTIQRAGVSTLVLTSRGHAFRAATVRELLANGYDFAKSALMLPDPPCGVFAPYDLDALENSGLTAEEAARFDLGSPRGITFERGLMMTAGQHKGAMLLTMLALSERQFKAVVFVDDHGRHVLRVYDALAGRGINVAAFHYKREDANVDRFKYGDKKDVAKRWRKLDRTLQEVFE